MTIIAGSSLLVAMEDKVFVLESIKNDYSQPISIRVTEGASSTGSQQRHVIAPGDTFYFYQKVPIYRGKVFLDIPGGQLTDEYEMLSYGSSLHLQAGSAQLLCQNNEPWKGISFARNLQYPRAKQRSYRDFVRLEQPAQAG